MASAQIRVVSLASADLVDEGVNLRLEADDGQIYVCLVTMSAVSAMLMVLQARLLTEVAPKDTLVLTLQDVQPQMTALGPALLLATEEAGRLVLSASEPMRARLRLALDRLDVTPDPRPIQ